MTSPDSPSDPTDATEPGEPDAGPGTHEAAAAALRSSDPEALQTDLGSGGDALEDAGLGSGRDEAEKGS